MFVSGVDSPILMDAMNMTGWLWAPAPWETVTLLRNQFVKLVIDAIGQCDPIHDPVEVGMHVEDKGNDGLWRIFQETHRFPSRERSLNLLSIDPTKLARNRAAPL